MKPALSIRTRLAVSATCLVLIVVTVISAATFREVRRTASAATGGVALGPSYEMLWRLGLMTLVLLLIAGAGAWMISGTLTRPITRLVTAAERMSAGDDTQRVDVARWDELGVLGIAFNAMAERDARIRAKLEHQVKELEATQDRLERVLSSSAAMLYELRLEPSGTVLDWISSNVTKLLGYDLSEVQRPRWWSDNVHPDDFPDLGGRPDPAAYHDGASEYRFRHKDGRYRWLREEQRLASGKTGEAIRVVGAWFDITEQRQLEAQFRQAQKIEAVGRLAGGIAHDFNNLLTIILAESQLVLADRAMNVTARRESLDQISKAAERAALLTRQLLTFSRRQLIEPTTLDLNVVVSDVDKMLRRLIGEDVDLRLALSETPVITTADRGQVEQVIVNLVVNARDAMPDGGVLTIETGITYLDQAYADMHTDVVPGRYATLSVNDSGIGMNDEVKAHIFEPFFTTKESGKGTGLGLATCYAIAKQFGGHVAAYSEVGLGTAMKLYLPASDAEEPSAVAAAADVEGGSETILLVEDEVQVRRLAARMLESRGYGVLEAAHGDEALRVFAEHRGSVQLLVTDVVLPGMGGRALADRVHELEPDLAVLFMSGYSDDVILRHRLLEHDVVLLQKPFTGEMLARKVREALTRQAK